jgi:mercuric ion transport protein
MLASQNLGDSMFGQLIEKISSVGTWLSALSCAACFPVLGSLTSTVGLGFLAQFEGIAINILLPLFASVALIGNAFNWYKHKRHIRGALSVISPIAVLLTLYPLWQYTWSAYLFYAALTLMLIMSLMDIFKPAEPIECQI